MFNLKDNKNQIQALAHKYGTVVPRYTSYPTAPEWKHEFSQEKFEEAIRESNKTGNDYSLYLHLPFCESQCYFCGCNVIISPKHGIENPYIARLKEELDYYSKLIDKNRKVVQMAWGGGTPTYLTPEQIKDLYTFIAERFNLYKTNAVIARNGSDEAIHTTSEHEYAIEIDPRFTSDEHIKALWECGFNRLSMGIQDFNEETQKTINRMQSYELVENAVNVSRGLGFTSINFDLIYGLPLQTTETFTETLAKIIKLNPDRIALFHYAHIPAIFAHQKKYITDDLLPSEEEKVKIFDLAVEKLTAAGYEFIGLDHFAKPNDSLALAQKNKTLYRNFQGYTTHWGCDLLGCGISSISDVHGVYKQNSKKINDYYESFFTTEKFMLCSEDDVERREIIKQIMCNGQVTINANKYREEINMLTTFQQDEVLNLKINNENQDQVDIDLTELGRFFVRNIAATFDTYLKAETGHKLFSTTL